MKMQTDLLEDFQNEINSVAASTGVRFANYIIDVIIFYVLSLLTGLLFGLFTIVLSTALIYLVTYLVYICYYTIMEGATQGKTIGKMITGSRATKDSGELISWNDAFIRSLCRIVPFEPFSAIGGYPWHDKWSNTKVVKQ